METLTANEARIAFGEALQKAQTTPIQITKSGKPFAILMSVDNYQKMEELKLQLLREKIARAYEDLENGRCSDGDIFFDELLAE